MQIDAETYSRMPAHLQALFTKDANPGRDEVIEAFPQSVARPVKRENIGKSGSGEKLSMFSGLGSTVQSGYYDTETSAARFFYSSKASKADRAGSKHPTVKPLSLMCWLVRLVTPPGGIVLDPFAGSGTTGQAAISQGFKAILVEREAEYVADIQRRMASSPLAPE